MKRCSTSLSSERCKFKPQWDITSYLSGWPSSANQQASAGQDVEKGEPSCTVGGNADWCSHSGKQYGVILKNCKCKGFMTQWFHFWDIYEETRNTNLKEHMHPCVQCSVIYKHQDLWAAQGSISRWMNTKAVVHWPNGILLGHKKEVDFTYLLEQHGWT